MNRAILPLLLAGASALGGCTTLGGTVKGDFTCRAPAGTCAPMTRIDAAAIGQVAEDGADPAVGPDRHPPRTGRGGSVAVRTGERMLSILLPAHVDETGVLHDAATVHAVVEQPGWTFTAATDPTSHSEISRSPAPSSLREAIAGASAPVIEGLETPPAQAPQPFSSAALPRAVDPGAPTAASLAAARAGHRIGSGTGNATPASAASAEPNKTVRPSLPPGKVVLPQGDAAAARARLKTLATPDLARLGKRSDQGTSPAEGDASPFSAPAGQEQPR
ncbi:Type IV conjugative transfer system lipoprotein (TraV) [Sphingomonas sp. EC-HK361]|uniref:TraV family lipoprotein n=1 Tax=Sphingomonas sp. EC-HK361 TaxID=2038397 RepID=UPI00125A678C|nr:TraV family lipoprotein [Sphingomonas sp. EC-HK361]VVT10126.1 Type IV conjugative transfer system lipoprotein (TraV) [Sphingomonas sp. EC-HK361]